MPRAGWLTGIFDRDSSRARIKSRADSGVNFSTSAPKQRYLPSGAGIGKPQSWAVEPGQALDIPAFQARERLALFHRQGS